MSPQRSQLWQQDEEDVALMELRRAAAVAEADAKKYQEQPDVRGLRSKLILCQVNGPTKQTRKFSIKCAKAFQWFFHLI
jgi:hypothetical protein